MSGDHFGRFMTDSDVTWPSRAAPILMESSRVGQVGCSVRLSAAQSAWKSTGDGSSAVTVGIDFVPEVRDE